jgi:hypothetical protein
MADSSPVEIYVDAWALRCIFAQSWLPARLSKGELIEKPKNKGYDSSLAGHPPKTRGQMFRYLDQNNHEVATVHYFHCDGFLVTEPDPKTITVGKTRYMIHPERMDAYPELHVSESERPHFNCMQRLKCCSGGPLAKVPLHHEASAGSSS